MQITVQLLRKLNYKLITVVDGKKTIKKHLFYLVFKYVLFSLPSSLLLFLNFIGKLIMWKKEAKLNSSLKKRNVSCLIW